MRSGIRRPTREWCYICKESKPIEEFRIYNEELLCKKCREKRQKSYQAQYYLDHKDDLLPKHRETALASYYRRRDER